MNKQCSSSRLRRCGNTVLLAILVLCLALGSATASQALMDRAAPASSDAPPNANPVRFSAVVDGSWTGKYYLTQSGTWTAASRGAATATPTFAPRPMNAPGPSPTWVLGAQARLSLPVVFRQWNLPALPTATATATRTATRTPTRTITRTATRTPTRTATPGNLTPGVHVLHNFSHYVDSGGSLHIVGEVFNNTANDLRLADVPVDFYDSQGQWLGSNDGYVWLDNLPAGEKTCFHVLTTEPAGWSYYEFGEPSGEDGRPLPNLTFLNHSGSPTDYGWYIVNGQIRNDHGLRVEWVKVLITVYDALGTVMGCDAAFAQPRDLAPSAIGTFYLPFYGRDFSSVASYRLQADGEPQ